MRTENGPVPSVPSDRLRNKYEHIESQRQKFLVYLFCGVAMVFLGLFAITAFHSRLIGLGITLLVMFIINTISFTILHVGQSVKLARRFAVIGGALLYLYLLATGGVNNTGMLWCYPTMAATMVLIGVKSGSRIIIVLLLATIVVFSLPMQSPYLAVYPTEIKVRFFASMLALMIFVALTEYARSRNQAELVRLSKQMDELSYTDLLTGLPNRRAVSEFLAAENSRRARYQRPLSILYGDIDNFKSINDTVCHEAGDQVLKAVATCLRNSLRDEDIVGRWGGEEFLIVVPEAGEDKAWEVGERLREQVEAMEIKYLGKPIKVTMSFGITTVHEEGRIEDFIHRADAKLLLAKRTGKNRCINRSAAASMA